MPLDPHALPIGCAAPQVPHLLEVAHVAHRLSMSPEYVYRLIRDGKLAVVRLGSRIRVDASDLQAFIDGQRESARSNGNGA